MSLVGNLIAGGQLTVISSRLCLENLFHTFSTAYFHVSVLIRSTCVHAVVITCISVHSTICSRHCLPPTSM